MALNRVKKIAVLGSSGSIGKQALELVKAHHHLFKAEVLTVNTSADVLIEQALTFLPSAVVITDESQYHYVKEALSSTSIRVLAGEEALSEVTQLEEVDIVLAALVGYSGLKPIISAIKSGKDIALANKEVLVVAGDLITRLVKQHQVRLLPVDSEHSAIFQCMQGEDIAKMEKLILTASGGPFRGKTVMDLKNVSSKTALKHPNWSMGPKISIDSASLMNKGLEVIEARWLFDTDVSRIEVLIHPQSIIHSMVQFTDGSIKAQLGLPDMKLPIQYALAYPERVLNNLPRLDFSLINDLTFKKPDLEVFSNLALAFAAARKGGNMPCILNAANEVAVSAFLKDEIGFLDMPVIIEQCMEKATFIDHPDYEDYVNSDKETRILAKELLVPTI